MNKTNISSIKKYAYAYMSSTSESDEEKISNLKEIIKHIPSVSFYLKNPSISLKVKQEIIKMVLPKNLIESSAYRFLILLIGLRVFDFDRILKECEDIFFRSQKRFRLVVRSRYPVSDYERDVLSEFFSQLLNMEPVVEWSQDNECIGGFIIRWDDMIIDSTVSKRIEMLKHKITQGDEL